MSKISRWQFLGVLFAILLLPSLVYLLLIMGKNHFKPLPIIGEREVAANGDTIYHTIPPFRFQNQEGKFISDTFYDGKIYVADFFFTKCTTICPKMSGSLQRVQDKFKAQRDLKLASFTVDPEADSVPVLRAYAKRFIVNSAKWNLMTGKKEDLYKLGVNGFLLPAQEDALDPEGFLHSEYCVLIDKQKRIRSMRDATDPAQVDTLIDEIMVLLQEK